MKAFFRWVGGVFRAGWQKLGPWLRTALSEASGAPSSIRLIMFGWHGAVGLVWLGLCIYERRMVPIHESVLAVLGIVSGLKTAQRFGEPDGPTCDGTK